MTVVYVQEEVLRTAVERLDQGEEPVEGLDEELFQMEQARAQYAELMQRRHEEMQQQRFVMTISLSLSPLSFFFFF